MSDQRTRFWNVYITVDYSELDRGYKGYKGRNNKTLGVVAFSAQAAIAIVTNAYKDRDPEIWTVQHRGEVHFQSMVESDHELVEYKDGWYHKEDQAK